MQTPRSLKLNTYMNFFPKLNSVQILSRFIMVSFFASFLLLHVRMPRMILRTCVGNSISCRNFVFLYPVLLFCQTPWRWSVTSTSVDDFRCHVTCTATWHQPDLRRGFVDFFLFFLFILHTTAHHYTPHTHNSVSWIGFAC